MDIRTMDKETAIKEVRRYAKETERVIESLELDTDKIETFVEVEDQHDDGIRLSLTIEDHHLDPESDGYDPDHDRSDSAALNPYSPQAFLKVF
ncbi:hypothetical protein [Leisingera caerulea]|jgi:hypothetical protein|nr:hypothetical protein [Leisingera caerulea]